MKPEGKRTEPETYPLSMGYLPPKFLKKAETELNENAENRKSKVEEVRKHLRKEEGIDDKWFTDEVIIMYLRSRKFDVQKTAATITRMANFIKKHDYYFQPIDPQLLDKMVKKKIVTFLPRRDKDGCAICLIRLKRWQPSDFSFKEILQFYILFLLHALNNPMTQVNGIKLIYDLKVPVMKYLKFFSPFNTYNVYQLLVECVPVRAKGVYVVNANTLAKLAAPLIIPLLPEKLKKRVKIHSDPTELLDYMQANLVPTEFGGQFCEEGCSNTWAKTGCMPDYVIAVLDSVTSSDRDKCS